MVDYDLPFVENDKLELLKAELLLSDADKNELVNYKELINRIRPKKKQAQLADIATQVIFIQKMARGAMARRRYKLMSDEAAHVADDIK